MVPLRATRPLSVASSQTGRRGHEVRHPSSTSAWVRGCRQSHSSRSQTSGVIVSFSLSIIAPDLAPLSRAVPICLASWITAVAIWRTSEACRAGARLSPSDGHNRCGQAYLRNARGAAIRNEALCDAERIGDDGLCLTPQPPACSAPLAEAPAKRGVRRIRDPAAAAARTPTFADGSRFIVMPEGGVRSTSASK